MGLLSCQAALDLVRSYADSLSPPETEEVPLESAAGRVLAKPIHADRDQPPFHRSTRDGYAMRSSDARPANALTVKGFIRAGEQWTGPPLQPGETIELMTGAPVPDGADAVLMLEHATLTGNTLMPARTLSAGENIVPRAAEAGVGDLLLKPGIRLGPAEIALAASVGTARPTVYGKPSVAILATGDELVPVACQPATMQIRNSNSYALAALVTANGGTPIMLPPAADTRRSLQNSIAAAADDPMLLLSGGVSAGKYDLVEEVLDGFGAELFFTGVFMQPGKPAVFGRIPTSPERAEQWIFGLPGNPISTQVTATLFAMPLLRALGGEAAAGPSFAQATLTEAVHVRPGLTRFLPAILTGTLAGTTVRPTGWQGSGDLNGNARANCYLVVPGDVVQLQAEDVVTVLLR